MATTSSIQDILMMYTWEDGVETHSTQEIIQHGRPKLFDFPYPLYDSKMKEQFEEDFIRHFYTRHIGSESIALFKLRLQDYLYLNSEKWERLYQSMDAELNPFHNIDVKKTRSTDESEQTDRDRTEDEAQVNTSKRDDLEDELQTTGRTKRDEENETQTTGRTKRDEETELQTNTTTTNEQEDSGTVRGVTSGATENTENQQNTNVTSHADDFTRNLEEETPDERLAITAQDGVGLVEYASNINENKNVNDSTQDTDVSGTNQRTSTGNEDETSDSNRTLIGSEDETKDSNRTLTGSEDETKEKNKTANENEDEIKDRLSSRESTENEQRDRNRTELEKQLRAFEQALDEHEIGRRTHQSFVQLYDEYIQHFQGLHRLMFKDMEKLFLGVF